MERNAFLERRDITLAVPDMRLPLGLTTEMRSQLWLYPRFEDAILWRRMRRRLTFIDAKISEL